MIEGMRTRLLFACISCMTIPVSVFPQTFKIEAEQYTDSYDIGGDVIGKVLVSDCSEGYVLKGLDNENEWTEYDLILNALGYYGVTMWCRGEAGMNYNLELILTPNGPGDAIAIDFSFTGRGLG